jgi:hypothetical protein
MLIPDAVRAVGDTELFITWNDGKRQLYPFNLLRFHCPCAGCVDEMTGERRIRLDQVKRYPDSRLKLSAITRFNSAGRTVIRPGSLLRIPSFERLGACRSLFPQCMLPQVFPEILR